MPTCKKCQTHFGNRTIIDGKVVNISKRKYCLSCSPYKLHNTRQLDNTHNTSCVCKTCGKTFEYSRSSGHFFTRCVSCISKSRHHKVKLRAIAYKGGKCEECGYSKCPAALTFHHTDVSNKEFTIGSGANRSWASVVKELDKCIMLCRNCHAERHYSPLA